MAINNPNEDRTSSLSVNDNPVPFSDDVEKEYESSSATEDAETERKRKQEAEAAEKERQEQIAIGVDFASSAAAIAHIYSRYFNELGEKPAGVKFPEASTENTYLTSRDFYSLPENREHAESLVKWFKENRKAIEEKYVEQNLNYQVGWKEVAKLELVEALTAPRQAGMSLEVSRIFNGKPNLGDVLVPYEWLTSIDDYVAAAPVGEEATNIATETLVKSFAEISDERFVNTNLFAEVVAETEEHLNRHYPGESPLKREWLKKDLMWSFTQPVGNYSGTSGEKLDAFNKIERILLPNFTTCIGGGKDLEEQGQQKIEEGRQLIKKWNDIKRRKFFWRTTGDDIKEVNLYFSDNSAKQGFNQRFPEAYEKNIDKGNVRQATGKNLQELGKEIGQAQSVEEILKNIQKNPADFTYLKSISKKDREEQKQQELTRQQEMEAMLRGDQPEPYKEKAPEPEGKSFFTRLSEGFLKAASAIAEAIGAISNKIKSWFNFSSSQPKYSAVKPQESVDASRSNPFAAMGASSERLHEAAEHNAAHHAKPGPAHHSTLITPINTAAAKAFSPTAPEKSANVSKDATAPRPLPPGVKQQ